MRSMVAGHVIVVAKRHRRTNYRRFLVSRRVQSTRQMALHRQVTCLLIKYSDPKHPALDLSKKTLTQIAQVATSLPIGFSASPLHSESPCGGIVAGKLTGGKN